MSNGKLPQVKTASSPCDHCGGRGTVKRADPKSLRKRREAAGLSLRQFAKLEPKFSPAYISDVELGRRGATPEMIARYEALRPAP